MGLHERAILLISRPALKVLTGFELHALAAHELAHDFLSDQFEQGRHGSARQELELECDGIATLTLIALGASPMQLLKATTKLNRFNDRFGTPSNIAAYPRSAEREQVISTAVRLIAVSRTKNPKHCSAS